MFSILGLDAEILKLIPPHFLNPENPTTVSRDFLDGTFGVTIDQVKLPGIESAGSALQALFMVHHVFNLSYPKGTEKFFRSMEKAFALRE
jgi:hypothetical protein